MRHAAAAAWAPPAQRAASHRSLEQVPHGEHGHAPQPYLVARVAPPACMPGRRVSIDAALRAWQQRAGLLLQARGGSVEHPPEPGPAKQLGCWPLSQDRSPGVPQLDQVRSQVDQDAACSVEGAHERQCWGCGGGGTPTTEQKKTKKTTSGPRSGQAPATQPMTLITAPTAQSAILAGFGALMGVGAWRRACLSLWSVRCCTRMLLATMNHPSRQVHSLGPACWSLATRNPRTQHPAVCVCLSDRNQYGRQCVDKREPQGSITG